MKLSTLASFVISLAFFLPQSVKAGDTVTVPQDFARDRVLKLDVTPMGLVIDLNSEISSVQISHMRNVVYRGIDGVLCDVRSDCPDGPRPTTLFLRKIAPINFKDEEPSPDGTSLLFVTTERGLYRFQLKPVRKTPDYTQIQIDPDSPSVPPNPLLE
jgi:hypothetical protein